MTTEDRHAATSNAADPAQVKAATKLRTFTDDTNANDLRLIFQSEPGKRFLLRLMAEARIWEDPFSTDSHRTAHDLGYQAFGRTLVTWLGQADPAAFPYLLLFRLEEKKRLEAAQAALSAKDSGV